MEEGAHLGYLSYRPVPQLWTGDKCPPPLVSEFCLERYSSVYHRDQTTGDLKSHHLQAGVTALSVPCVPHLFFQQHMIFFYFLMALMASSGARALQPPPPPWVRLCIYKTFFQRQRHSNFRGMTSVFRM